MSIYKVNQASRKLELHKPSSFVTEKMSERKDLQPLIRESLSAIDDELLLIAEEFDRFAGSNRRVDLLCLDTSGNLVVIELKVVEDGSHMELQSLRYAAMLSAFTFEQVVAAHEQYLTKNNADPLKARTEIENFLNANGAGTHEISNSPRIILIAPSFSQEISQTVLWLNSQGLDIRCHEIKLYVITGEKYIDIEQVIPLPTATQYQFALQDKASKQRAASNDASPKTVDTLVAAGVLRDQTRIILSKPPIPNYDISSLPADVKYAKYMQQSNRFRWDNDGLEYTLTGLTTAVYRFIGGTDKPFRGSDYWSIEGETKPLTQRANELPLRNLSGPATPPIVNVTDISSS